MQADWTETTPWNEQPALTGIMRPVTEELAVECEVEGTLPPELDGVVFRNGPNQKYEPRTPAYHFFDGDGMAHGLRIGGGQAHYRNRWVRTECFELQEAAGRSLWGGLMDNPLRVRPPRGAPRFKAHGGVNIVWHAGQLLALDEIGLPWRIDPGTLQTLGAHDYDGRWRGPMTPHPKFDTATGEMITFGYDVMRRPLLDYAVVRPRRHDESRDLDRRAQAGDDPRFCDHRAVLGHPRRSDRLQQGPGPDRRLGVSVRPASSAALRRVAPTRRGRGHPLVRRQPRGLDARPLCLGRRGRDRGARLPDAGLRHEPEQPQSHRPGLGPRARSTPRERRGCADGGSICGRVACAPRRCSTIGRWSSRGSTTR